LGEENKKPKIASFLDYILRKFKFLLRSLASIVTSYRANDRQYIPGTGTISLFDASPSVALGTAQPSSEMVLGALSGNWNWGEIVGREMF
jgi:hypothetical protein